VSEKTKRSKIPFEITLSDEELNLIEEAAKSMGLDVESFVRFAVLREAHHALKVVGWLNKEDDEAEELLGRPPDF